MSRLVLILTLCVALFGKDILPSKVVKLDSPAADMVLQNGALYACTANGDVLEVGAKNKKLYSLPHFSSATGEKRAQRALSLDVDSKTKSVAVAAEDGCLYVGKNGALQKSGFCTNSVIKKVALVSENLALIALVSSQITLFDTAAKKELYTVQVGSSPLGDMALSSERKTAAIVTEAGTLYMLETSSGKLRATYKNVNLDNIYKVDYQNRTLLTAGQDRRATLLGENGAVKAKFDGEFLIYAAALSPSAAKAAVAIDEQNNIAVFDTATKMRIATAKGHTATLNRIVFLSESQFASAADENKILFWSVK